MEEVCSTAEDSFVVASSVVEYNLDLGSDLVASEHILLVHFALEELLGNNLVVHFHRFVEVEVDFHHQ